MSTNQIIPGIIYEVNDLLPVHHSSGHYKENARVVPDGINWTKVKCPDGDFAFNNSECGWRLVKAKEVDGSEVTIHSRYSHFIQGNDENGDEHFFTCEEAAKAHEFDFSIRLGRYHKKTCERFYGDETLMDYHDGRINSSVSDKLPSFVTDDDEYKIGLEVEKVDSRVQRDKLVFELLQNTGWKKERDGSLNSGGYEMVSPILPLLDMNRIDAACLPVLDYINAQSDDSCGGHINLSRKNTSSEELLKSMKGIAPIIYCMYEKRITNRFCQVKNWRDYFRYPEKYSAFYLKNRSILEIRIFSRVTNYQTLKWRIKFLQVVLGDYGNNLNQYILKLSSKESKLYKTMREQFTHDDIKQKITRIDILSQRYGCGKISKSIRKKVNDRFGEIVLPL